MTDPEEKAMMAAQSLQPMLIVIDSSGTGTFRTEGGNVSVWVRKGPFEDLIVNE